MTINELLAEAQAAADAGFGDAKVVIDTDAACYNVHIIDDVSASFEDGVHMPDGQPMFIISPRTYHGICSSRTK